MTNVVATPINSLPMSGLITVPATVLNALVDQVQSLTAKVKALEKRQDESHETLNLNIAQDRKRISTLETRSSAPQSTAPQPGSKTADRIDMIGHILKERGPIVSRNYVVS